MKICRIKPEAAMTIALPHAAKGAADTATQMQLPVHMLPNAQQVIQAIAQGTLGAALSALTQMGIFLAVDETSPVFQQLGAHTIGAPGNVTAVTPVVRPAPVQQPFAPALVPNPPFNPNGQAYPQVPPVVPAPPQPLPPGAIVPGQPLPPLRPPTPPVMPHGPGSVTLPPQPVPVQAPVMGGGEAPSLTESNLPPMPSFLG